MPTLKLNIVFQGFPMAVACDYQPPEDAESIPAIEDLQITGLVHGGEVLIAEVDGDIMDSLNLEECLDLTCITHDKFAEFKRVDEEAEYSNDTDENPHGEWV